MRLTQYAHGGGCACKIPPGELEDAVRGLTGQVGPTVLVGLDDGDDAAAVRVQDGLAVLSTADFFTPVVDDAYDWGRIAAANALSDIYAMGGTPVTAINLVGWPREKLPMELLTEVLRGGLAVAQEAGCPVIGGHSIDNPGPTYGMAVTGTADPERLLRNDAAEAGLPITLTKPIGVGILNNRHKRTGEQFPKPVAVMTTLNRDAARAALDAGVRAATDVTGFGLLGHLHKMCRASGVGAEIELAAVPVLEAARTSLADGFVPRRQPPATSTGYARTCTPRASARTTWCCSPTPRPPAACSWSVSSPVTRSSDVRRPQILDTSPSADPARLLTWNGPIGLSASERPESASVCSL